MTARVCPEGSFDVLVVGGGLAGLTAAWNLRSGGFTVAVLEAKDRVGGRLLLQTTSDGVSVDGGGSWVGRMPSEVIRLMNHFGLHLASQYNDGQNLLRLNGQIVSYRGDIPRLSPDMTSTPDNQIPDNRSEPHQPWAAIQLRC